MTDDEIRMKMKQAPWAIAPMTGLITAAMLIPAEDEPVNLVPFLSFATFYLIWTIAALVMLLIHLVKEEDK